MSRESEIRSLELALLEPDVGQSPVFVAQVLHPEFREISRTGRQWSRDEVIHALRTERREQSIADNWHFSAVGPALTLVTYRVLAPTGMTARTSLWDLTTGMPRLRFHQSTPFPGSASVTARPLDGGAASETAQAREDARRQSPAASATTRGARRVPTSPAHPASVSPTATSTAMSAAAATATTATDAGGTAPGHPGSTPHLTRRARRS